MIFHVSKLNVGLLRYEKTPTQISIMYKIVWNVYMWEKYEAPIHNRLKTWSTISKCLLVQYMPLIKWIFVLKSNASKF